MAHVRLGSKATSEEGPLLAQSGRSSLRRIDRGPVVQAPEPARVGGGRMVNKAILQDVEAPTRMRYVPVDDGRCCDIAIGDSPWPKNNRQSN